ncbi:C3a anaphylatoxin chemotactic receptor [Hoplias malabaricus]|uniref:C3a anaphylatoxin chemotactic receptor n=1 Tax=Hoplias malabaricus TaxID=27720 RepID=UPI0034623716
MAGEKLNSSDSSSYPNEAVRVIQMVVTVLIFVVGVTLNGLVVWVLGLRRRRRGSIGGSETQGAGSFRIYVVNLALADLVLLLRTPLALGYLAHHFSWPFGITFCQIIMFLRCLGLYAGAFMLSAVALERCLCLLRPVWSRMKRPRWVVPLVCVVLWIIAAILSVPYFTLAGLSPWQNKTQCIENTHNVTATTLVVLETVPGFLLPLLLFITCNIVVMISARKAERVATSPTSPISSPTSPNGPIYTSQRMARLYRILFLTMILFLTCWVPYFICRFLKALSAGRKGWEKMNHRAMEGAYASLFLVYIKCALNPILYAFAARGLRRTVRASLFSTIERIFNEDISESLRRKSLRRKDSQFQEGAESGQY